MNPARATKLFAGLLVFLAMPDLALAQDVSNAPTVSHPSSRTVSPRLSDLPDAHWHGSPMDLKVHPRPLLPPLPERAARPSTSDLALQSRPGAALTPGSKTAFEGIGENGSVPGDPNIAVGQTNPLTGVGYIVQVVNTEIAVFDKSGNLMMPTKSLSSLWAPLGGGCASNNAGDPVVQYDNLAPDGLNGGGTGRWIVTQLGSLSAPYSQCIAVSQTSDPTGYYNLYSYTVLNSNYLNDYPKFGIWPTANNPAYLATYNLFQNGHKFIGAALCVYDRTAMLANLPAAQICQKVADGGGYLPADLDGANPPGANERGYFLSFNTTNSLRMYRVAPKFLAPASATFAQVIPDISVLSFAEACNGGSCIPQPMTRRQLDSLGDRLMYRLAYRDFSTALPTAGNCFGTTSVICETMVVNHSVNPGLLGSANAGVRWYQLLSTTSPPKYNVLQQGTYAPDATNRWMGSAAMDQNGNIALGYSASSGSVYPSVAATYRCPTTAPGKMGGELAIQPGGGSQTGLSRWGDYSALRVDPTDDLTFWYTNQWYAQTSSYVWSTAIGSFTVGTCP